MTNKLLVCLIVYPSFNKRLLAILLAFSVILTTVFLFLPFLSPSAREDILRETIFRNNSDGDPEPAFLGTQTYQGPLDLNIDVKEIQEEIESVYNNLPPERKQLLSSKIEEKFTGDYEEGSFLVTFPSDMPNSYISAVNIALGNEDIEEFYQNLPVWLEGTPFEKTRYINVNEKDDIKEEMLKYLSSNYVADVSLNYIFTPLTGWSTDDSKAYPDDWKEEVEGINHWYFEDIDLPKLWYAQGCHLGSCTFEDDPTKDIVIAIIDTGLNYEDGSWGSFSYYDGEEEQTISSPITFGVIPDLANLNLWENPNSGVAFGVPDENHGVCNDIHGFDANMWVYNRIIKSDPVDCSSPQFAKEGLPYDDQGHGNYVTGVIAAEVNNNAQGQTVGIFPNVQIMPIKYNVPFSGSGFAYSSIVGIYYATYHGADIINISLGGSSSVAEEDAVNYAASQGVVIVASSGNCGDEENEPNYPASYSSVISVGAVDNTGSRSSYSTYNSYVDFVAPVGDLPFAYNNGMWHYNMSCSANSSCNATSDFTIFSIQSKQGTSFASPQVAAAAAFIKSFNPSLSPSQIKQVLVDTVVDIGTSGKNDETGYGLLNLYNIYEFFELSSTVNFSVLGGNGSIQATAGGSPITTGAMLTNGVDITFTATPNADYRVKDWLVNDVSQELSETIFSFSDLQSNITVKVEFELDYDYMEFHISSEFDESTQGWGVTHFTNLTDAYAACLEGYVCDFIVYPNLVNKSLDFVVEEEGDKMVANVGSTSTTFIHDGIKVKLPFDLSISGPITWDGTFNLPGILSQASTLPSSYTSISKIFTVGNNTHSLEFSSPVRLLIPSDANKLVGYVLPSSQTFVEVLSTCSADLSPVGLGDVCKINVENDLVLWTTHFTEFITYTDTSSDNEEDNEENGNESPVSSVDDETLVPVLSGAEDVEVLPNTNISKFILLIVGVILIFIGFVLYNKKNFSLMAFWNFENRAVRNIMRRNI